MGQADRVSHVEKTVQKPQLLSGLGTGARDIGVPLEVTRHRNTKEGGRRNNWDGNGVNMKVESRGLHLREKIITLVLLVFRVRPAALTQLEIPSTSDCRALALDSVLIGLYNTMSSVSKMREESCDRGTVVRGFM